MAARTPPTMGDFGTVMGRILGVLPRLRTPLQLSGVLVCIVSVLIVKIISPDNVAAMMSAGMIGVGLIIFATMFMVLPLILQKQRAIFFAFMFLVYTIITGYLVTLTYQFIRSASLEITDQGIATVSATLQKRVASLTSTIEQEKSDVEQLQTRVNASQSLEERNQLTSALEQANRKLNQDQADMDGLLRREADLAGTRELAEKVIVELQKLSEEESADPKFKKEIGRAKIGAANGQFSETEILLKNRLTTQLNEQAKTLLLLGQVKELQGDIVEADNYYQKALEMSDADPVITEYSARTKRLLGRFSEARKAYERLIARGDTERSKVWLLANLGISYWEEGNFEKAEEVFNDAYQQSGPLTLDRALVAQNWGSFEWDRDRFETAEKLLQEAHDIYQVLPNERRFLVFETENNLGGVLLALGKYAAARKYLVDARSIEEKTLSRSSAPFLETTANLMLSHCRPGDQESQSSESELQQDLVKSVIGRHELAVLENALGECYEYQWEFEPAISHFQRAYDALTDGEGESITLRARVSIGLAEIFIRQGQPRLATEVLQKEEDTISIGSKKKPRVAASFQTTRGDLASVEKRFDHAIPYYEEAIMIFVTLIGPDHPNRFWPEMSFAEAAMAMGDEVSAREHLRVAEGLVKRFFDPTSVAARKLAQLSSQIHLM